MVTQTGDWLLKQMQSKGGKPNEYADLVFGKVIATSPLQVRLSNNMILPNAVLMLGRHVSKYKVKMSYSDRQENGKDETRTETVTIDESLKSGDGVAMIRADGGQSFYIFEKLGG